MGGKTGKKPDGTRVSDPRLTLQTVVRAMDVLEAIGASGGALSLAEIASAVGIDRSAAQRIAHTFEGLGYLERSDGGIGFRPGRRLLDRCFDYLRGDPLVERATPVLIELRKVVRERVDLSLFDGGSLVYAVRLQSKRESFYATLIGRRFPTWCTSGGRAMLAHLPDDEVDAILDEAEFRPFTQNTITSRDDIWARIREARERGFATSEGEVLMGEIAIGAAILGGNGRPVGAVHIAGSLSEWPRADFETRFAPMAMETAQTLSR